MKIGLIKCDSVKPHLQGYCGDYGQMFLGAFVNAVPQVNLLSFDARTGVYPVDLDECDAYLFTGSTSSVYDNDEWIGELKEFVRECHDLKVKIVGVCFGHQLIAEALGGRVMEAKSGWGAGAKIAKVYEKADWMKPSMDSFTLYYSHSDQVSDLPTGAVLHAGNEHCANGMFSIGNHVLAIQAHPEFTTDYAHALIYEYRDDMPGNVFNSALQSLNLKTDNVAIMRWIANFINS